MPAVPAPVRGISFLFLQEKKECQQKLAKEQGALREQLQVRDRVVSPRVPPDNSPFSRSEHVFGFLLKVHIQTIGILVSEKADLQSALAHTQQAARQKAGGTEHPPQPGTWQASGGARGSISTPLLPGESEDLANRLQTTRQRVGELERTLSAVSTQQKQVDRVSPAACPATGSLVS